MVCLGDDEDGSPVLRGSQNGIVPGSHLQHRTQFPDVHVMTEAVDLPTVI